MTTTPHHDDTVRRVADALELQYADAARVVAGARTGRLDQALGRPLMPLDLPAMDPHAYDPMTDTLRAFVRLQPRGTTVTVATRPLWDLVDDLFDLGIGDYALVGLRALHDKLGMGDAGTFDLTADTNPVPVTLAEGILDVCAAFCGPRLVDDFDAWVSPRGALSRDFTIVLGAAGALYAALERQDPDDGRANAEKLLARWQRLLDNGPTDA